MTGSVVHSRLEPVHALRRRKAQAAAARAASRTKAAAEEEARASREVERTRRELQGFAAKQIAEIESYPDLESFFAALAMGGDACRRAVGEAESTLSSAGAASEVARSEGTDERRALLRATDRADRNSELAAGERLAIRRRTERRAEEAAGDLRTGRRA